MGAPTRQYTDFLIQIVKDFRTSLDYLKTRPDIDSKKLAYLGSSWGSEAAPVILAVENRVKAGLLVVRGVQRTRSRPEADAINYITQGKMPVLLLNGRYDMIYPYETIAKPLFALLGTPAKDKVQKVYDADHFVPRNELVKETLAWLDRYLGPVK
jgi:dienelactone hydrolase